MKRGEEFLARGGVQGLPAVTSSAHPGPSTAATSSTFPLPGRLHLFGFDVLVRAPFAGVHWSVAVEPGRDEEEAWAAVERKFEELHPERGWGIVKERRSILLLNLSADNPALIEEERRKLMLMAIGTSACPPLRAARTTVKEAA
jgi:hypothetical protein